MKKILEDIYSSNYTSVYTYIFSLCHDVYLSEDLTSEVFLEAVKLIKSFR